MVDLSRSKRSAQVLFDTPSAFHFASKSRSASVNCLYRLILNHLPRLILGVALNYRTSILRDPFFNYYLVVGLLNFVNKIRKIEAVKDMIEPNKKGAEGLILSHKKPAIILAGSVTVPIDALYIP